MTLVDEPLLPFVHYNIQVDLPLKNSFKNKLNKNFNDLLELQQRQFGKVSQYLTKQTIDQKILISQ